MCNTNKLMLMKKLVDNSKQWTKELARQHGEEMKKILDVEVSKLAVGG